MHYSTPHSTTEKSEKTPVFVLTDDGRDVDDAEAIAFFVGSKHTEIAGIATTHMIPDRRAMIARAFLSHLGEHATPIGVGSIFPVEKEDAALVQYLREHTIEGRTYEGVGLIECFPSAEEVLYGAIQKYGKALRVAALAPLTDLAKFARSYPDEFRKIGGLYIQGQAHVEGGTLLPDTAAYNLKEDEEAANTVFSFQNDIPFTLIGKWAAYELPLLRADFDRFEATENPAGTYLKRTAIEGIRCFAERSPEIFQRVFGIHPDELETLDELSKPYDALVAMAIENPVHFAPIQIGKHALIGMNKESPGVSDPEQLKEKLVSTIVKALSAGNASH